jgi:hypothetical protein
MSACPLQKLKTTLRKLANKQGVRVYAHGLFASPAKYIRAVPDTTQQAKASSMILPRDDFTPGLHHRRPEGSVRPGRGEVALDVEGILDGCVRNTTAR